jgi:flagellar assembly protein FliH
MWSDQTSRATRITELGSVSSFWGDVDPGDRQACAEPSPYVSAPPPAEPPPPPREVRPSLPEIERDAFTKGYAQGERAGAEAAARRGDAMLRRLAQTIEELAALRADLVQKTELQVVELAVAIAERILHREVALDRELLVTMARVAIDRLGENTSATIKLNPEDYEAIGASATADDRGIVRVVADPLVNSGGCLVQSDFGLIDLTLDAQLGEMAAALGVGPVAAQPRLVQERGAA